MSEITMLTGAANDNAMTDPVVNESAIGVITMAQIIAVLTDHKARAWAGHCVVARHRPRMLVMLAGLHTGAHGVLLAADMKDDIWLVLSGLRNSAHADRLILTGNVGLQLKVTLTTSTLSGKIALPVNPAKRPKNGADFDIVLHHITGQPKRPSASPA